MSVDRTFAPERRSAIGVGAVDLLVRDLLIDLAVEPEIVRAMHIATRLQHAAPRAAPDEVDLLVWAIDDDDPVTAIGALHAVAGVIRPDVDRVLVEALHDQRPWIREHAAWVLAARRSQPAAFSPLADLLGSPSSLTAMVAQRTLVTWAEHRGGGLARVLEAQLERAEAATHRRRLVDTLGAVCDERSAGVLCAIVDDSAEFDEVRIAAVGALGHLGGDRVDRVVRCHADDSSPLGTAALLALDDLKSATTSGGANPATAVGLRIGQLTLTGELGGLLDRAGTGDTGGVATLLVSLGHAFALHPSVDSVLTLGRATPDGELASLLVPDTGREAYAGISVGTSMTSLADAWDTRLQVERSIHRALRNRPPLDVLHLRMADVGTLAAASVARQLGVAVAFTCAPDPHAPTESRQAAGLLDRESFGAVDHDEHLWFRARMVERLAAQADQLVLLPRRGAAERVQRLVDIDADRLERDGVIAPEGIDVRVVDHALETVANGRSDVPAAVAARIPEGRRGRPIVVTVGRLHPVKGVDRIVQDWLGDEWLSSSTNLVLVGGDLDDPNPTEAAVLEQIRRRCDGDDNGDGVIMLGAMPRAQAAQVMALARFGHLDVISPGGVFVNGSAKEEFGLALLEALATGLPVVAPREGGPGTYVSDEAGLLVDASQPLAPAMRAAFDLYGRVGRIEAVRAMIDACYTIEACADALVAAYERVPLASH